MGENIMKERLSILLAVFIALVFILDAPATVAYAQENPDTDIVYTENELADWCNNHWVDGGMVALGADIILTPSFIIYEPYNTITIDTGPFGIVYDGRSLPIGVFELIGEGVDTPVLTIANAGAFRTNWLHTVSQMKITATGRHNIGGTALSVLKDDGWLVNFSYFSQEGKIRAYGSGAVGVHLAAPMDLYCLSVEVEGENSNAVFADGGANLYYCKLSARGNNALAISGSGEIVLDACAAIPEPHNATVINRRLLGVVGRQLYLPLRLGGSVPFSFSSNFTFMLSGKDGVSPVYQQFYLDWGADLRNIVNTGVLGRTVIPGSLEPVFCGLGLEDG